MYVDSPAMKGPLLIYEDNPSSKSSPSRESSHGAGHLPKPQIPARTTVAPEDASGHLQTFKSFRLLLKQQKGASRYNIFMTFRLD